MTYDLWPCRECGHESYLHEHDDDEDDSCGVDGCECNCFQEPSGAE